MITVVYEDSNKIAMRHTKMPSLDKRTKNQLCRKASNQKVVSKEEHIRLH